MGRKTDGAGAGPARRGNVAYRKAAVIAMNTGLLFLGLNLLSIPFARLLGRRSATHGRSENDLRAAYPGWSAADIEALLVERDRNNRWDYEAFTEYRQKVVAGRFINVVAEGFRRGKRVQRWPPPLETCAVFFFGGSTAYGDGLPDWETIPAALEGLLAPTHSCRGWSVYNFGRPGYYSTQERILFEQLLQSGYVPRVAVFFDGLNDFFYPEPPGDGRPWQAGQTGQLARLVSEHETAGSRHRFFQLFWGLPLTRVLRSALPNPPRPPAPECEADRILGRWRANRRLIEGAAGSFDVRPLFVWQPIPALGETPGRRAREDGRTSLGCARKGYEAFARTVATEASGSLLWLADLPRGRAETLTVDDVHYTAAFSREIASEIGNALAPAR